MSLDSFHSISKLVWSQFNGEVELRPYIFTPATMSASRNVNEARTVIASILDSQWIQWNGFAAGSIEYCEV